MTKNYNTTLKNQKFVAWVTDTMGNVLIKENTTCLSKLGVKDVTFEANSEDNLVDNIQTQCGIPCLLSDLEVICLFENSSSSGTVYILEMNMDTVLKDSIISLYKGLFVNYIDMENYIHSYIRPAEKEIDFLETYVALISFLDRKYGSYDLL